MPNWIEGTLKLRGEAESLRNFFEKGVTPVGDKTEYEGGAVSFYIQDDARIIEAARAYAGPCNVEFALGAKTVCLPFQQAWRIDPEELAEISKKYGIDIRVYGFEGGLQFCQEIEVLNGQVTIDREIRYDDWDWECPMPLMGG